MYKQNFRSILYWAFCLGFLSATAEGQTPEELSAYIFNGKTTDGSNIIITIETNDQAPGRRADDVVRSVSKFRITVSGLPENFQGPVTISLSNYSFSGLFLNPMRDRWDESNSFGPYYKTPVMDLKGLPLSRVNGAWSSEFINQTPVYEHHGESPDTRITEYFQSLAVRIGDSFVTDQLSGEPSFRMMFKYPPSEQMSCARTLGYLYGTPHQKH